MTAPNPGSPEAVAAGCSCLDVDERMFAQRAWYRLRHQQSVVSCPIHGCTCHRSNHAGGSEPLADPACPVHPARGDDGECDAE